MNLEKTFTRLANLVAHAAGRPLTFAICVALVLAWAATGPVFKFSETWQLVINTGTTIVTFLMVFLIQNTQNRDSLAIQAKLDDLILMSDAEDAFVGIEKMTDKQLETLQRKCEARARAHADAHEHVKKVVAARGAKSPPPTARGKSNRTRARARRKTS